MKVLVGNLENWWERKMKGDVEKKVDKKKFLKSMVEKILKVVVGMVREGKENEKKLFGEGLEIEGRWKNGKWKKVMWKKEGRGW